MSVFDKSKLSKMKGESVKRHTIMIVDDEPHQLSVLKSLLSDEYNILTARDGQEALDMIKTMENPENIALIISDQRMPNITGVDFFKRLLDDEIIPNTKRIILTAYDEKEVIKKAVNEAQIYQFILKRFDPDDLKLRVKRAVEAFDLQMKLNEAGYIDYLTGMMNRRFLYENIDSYLRAEAKINSEDISKKRRKLVPSNWDLAFLLMDLDGFKDINDTYGHSIGDEILKQFAKIIRDEFRQSDIIVRWGGDEFLIVSKFSDIEQVKGLAGRLCQAVDEKRFDLGNGETIHLTCSIGFAPYPFLHSHPDLFSWENVFDIADNALYAVKWSGKKSWLGLFSTDKTKPENLYESTGKGKKKMLPKIKQLRDNGELKVVTIIHETEKNPLKWRKEIIS